VDQAKRDDIFLEFGLLLIVTGLFVAVLITGLVLVFSRTSAFISSWPLTVVGAIALSSIAALVLFLARRLGRLIADG
jgi:hypothetical protein